MRRPGHPKPRLHHVGLVVRSLDTYLESALWKLRGEVVYDPIQKARLCLVTIGDDPDEREALIELVEPENEDSRVWNALERERI